MARSGTDDAARLFSLGSRLGLLPWQWWEMYWAALETIGYRTAMMAAGGLAPSAAQRRENYRMVREKAQAGLETARALATPDPALPLALGEQWWRQLALGMGAGTRLFGEPQQYVSLALSWPLLMAETAADAVDVAVSPWHRRVTANARRLRRRRR